MPAVKDPGSVWSFLSGISFTLASLFSDILLIRVFLLLAYVFLLVTGGLGMPSWPGVSSNGQIGLETIVFSSINIVTHFAAIVRLLYDERKITFDGDLEECLWRFLYRRGGFERLEAREVIRRGCFREVAAGDVVLAEDEASEKVCVLMSGRVTYCRRRLSAGVGGGEEGGGEDGDSEEGAVTGTLLSGAIFDIRLLSILGVYTGFDDHEGTIKGFSARANTPCLLFDLPLDKLDELTTKCGPAVSLYFRNFLLCDLALQFEYQVDGHQHARSSNGELEDEVWKTGAMSRDFTEEVVDEPVPTLGEHITGFFTWIKQSFSPLVPSGVRHVGLRGLPRTGLAAARRLQALARASARAELVRSQRQQKIGLFQRVSSRFRALQS